MTAAIFRRLKFASAALLIAVVLMGIFGVDRSRDLPARYDSPMLALEMAQSQQQVDQIAGGRDTGTRKRFRLNTWIDFGFLVAYGWFFFLLARLLRLRTFRHAKALGTIAAIAAIGGAAFDVVENVVLFSVLDGGTGFGWLRAATLAKWGAIGVTACLLVCLFLRRLPVDTRLKFYCLAVAALYAIGGGMLLFGVLLDGPRHYALEGAIEPLALANLVAICVGAFRRNRAEFEATL